ncbi:hypothetical protein OG194_42445 [Streptomyces sp. NBC_01288]|uniref:hypothetical protein n=1 Tax=Streptomyces sp. NBC_01288 TaxID=2903814 RepID=UPI002E115856|nr:hypothetical protein OG194_42445 [Streptomyces sp. NBC_01288]
MTVGVSPVDEGAAAVIRWFTSLIVWRTISIQIPAVTYFLRMKSPNMREPAVRPYKSLVSGCREEVGENDD